tara:strand:- start:2301 stop:2570 length:270 start_codon:yes stop_codon:yes gene_type:complete
MSNVKTIARPFMGKDMVEWGVLCPTRPKKGDLVLVTSRKGKMWIAMIRHVVREHNGEFVALTDKVKITKDKDAESRRIEWMISQGLDPF